MRQPKKPREVRHCPKHGKVRLLRRRGCQTKMWMWFCPMRACDHIEYES